MITKVTGYTKEQIDFCIKSHEEISNKYGFLKTEISDVLFTEYERQFKKFPNYIHFKDYWYLMEKLNLIKFVVDPDLGWLILILPKSISCVSDEQMPDFLQTFL